MAYIRIPTGMQTVTATVSRKSYIKYQCCKCGKSALHEYALSQQASGTYHVFQSDATKKNVENNAGAKATQVLDQQDAALFNAINLEHNYDSVSQEIKCPYCGLRQPWSKIPRPWRKTKLFGLWIVGLVLFVIDTVAMLSFAPAVGVLFAIPTALVALLPFFHSIKRKKALQRIQTSTFSPPVYYNKQNIQEILSPLKLEQNQENTLNEPSTVSRCPNCGSQLNPSDRFCGQCGFRLN